MPTSPQSSPQMLRKHMRSASEILSTDQRKRSQDDIRGMNTSGGEEPTSPTRTPTSSKQQSKQYSFFDFFNPQSPQTSCLEPVESSTFLTDYQKSGLNLLWQTVEIFFFIFEPTWAHMHHLLCLEPVTGPKLTGE